MDTGLKPYFIKKLPTRVELLAGTNLSFGCHMRKKGCRPWFIKKLPARMELKQGQHLYAKCVISEATEESITIAAKQFHRGKNKNKIEPKQIDQPGMQRRDRDNLVLTIQCTYIG